MENNQNLLELIERLEERIKYFEYILLTLLLVDSIIIGINVNIQATQNMTSTDQDILYTMLQLFHLIATFMFFIEIFLKCFVSVKNFLKSLN